LLKQFGCIACRHRGLSGHSVEIHHLVEGYRLGHEYTIPLCIWHHRGERENLNVPMAKMREFFGPSLAREKKQFVREFGSERELLEGVNQWLDRNRIRDAEKKAQEQSENFFPF
jgi:AraC-like DNA-binding protein